MAGAKCRLGSSLSSRVRWSVSPAQSEDGLRSIPDAAPSAGNPRRPDSPTAPHTNEKRGEPAKLARLRECPVWVPCGYF